MDDWEKQKLESKRGFKNSPQKTRSIMVIGQFMCQQYQVNPQTWRFFDREQNKHPCIMLCSSNPVICTYYVNAPFISIHLSSRPLHFVFKKMCRIIKKKWYIDILQHIAQSLHNSVLNCELSWSCLCFWLLICAVWFNLGNTIIALLNPRTHSSIHSKSQPAESTFKAKKTFGKCA